MLFPCSKNIRSILSAFLRYLSIIIYIFIIYVVFRLIQGGIYVLLLDRGRMYARIFPFDSFENGLEFFSALLIVIGEMIYLLLLLIEIWRQYISYVLRWRLIWKLAIAGLLLLFANLFHVGIMRLLICLCLLMLFSGFVGIS